ncbi:MAG: hypothetical protein R6U85_00700 [Salinivirgaceae bacterium]
MKKTLTLTLVVLLTTAIGYSQTFSTGQTLKPKKWSVGFEPAILINGDSEFMLFGHAGYGLTKGVDLALKFGFLSDYGEYIGGDVEFGLGRYFSVMGGAHHFGDFGLDGNILGTYPIRSDVRLTSGFDLDINFIDNYNDKGEKDGKDTQFIGWIPISLEVGIKKNMAFIFEASINVTDVGYHFIGGGLNFYI